MTEKPKITFAKKQYFRQLAGQLERDLRSSAALALQARRKLQKSGQRILGLEIIHDAELAMAIKSTNTAIMTVGLAVQALDIALTNLKDQT